MKKTIAILFISLVISSCSGYFGDMSNKYGEDGGLKTLALVGGGTLSDDAAQDTSPFLFRYNGKAYLFFSSDRTGLGDIYYAEMDSDGRFHAPVMMDTTNINNSFYPDISPVVFSYNGNVYISFIRPMFPSYQFVYTYLLDSNFNSISNLNTITFGAPPFISNIGMIQDPTNPKLLLVWGNTNIEVRTLSTGYWVSNNNTITPFPVESANGFSMGGMDYYILSSAASLFGKRQIMGGIVSPMTNVFMRAADYISSYDDTTPFVDPITYKVYFASDRYGKGNYDLYRYNTLTFNYFMSSAALPVFLPQAVYVSTNGSDANSGLTPSSPLLTINKAIIQASLNSVGYIIVTAGIYTQGNGLDTNGSGVLINSNLNPIIIMGGFDLSFSSNTNNAYTVLDGLGTLKHVVQFKNAMGVIMSGFVIRNGNANGSYPDNMGGGVLINNSMGCYIVDSMISNNSAINGGGVCLTNSMACSVQNSTISWNSATNGGGIYVDNQMNYFSSLTNINNFARNYGGAFYFYGIPQGIIDSCIITNDYALNTNSVIYILGGGAVSPLFSINNNLIGGMNSSSYAIYQEAQITGHFMTNNIFITNKINYLYRYDYLSVESIISNTPASWFDITNTVKTGAIISTGNKVTNI